MIKCPHCGADHDRGTQGRFCSSCGRSVVQFTKRDDEEGAEQTKKIACAFCGILAEPPRCPACGGRIRVPDDWEE